MGQKIDLTTQVQGILPEANGGMGANAGLRFADDETPAGVINGSNQTFTLANAPSPAASLLLFLNKVLQLLGTDYTLSGATITMAVAPSGTPSFVGWYRYFGFSFAKAFNETLVMSDALTLNTPVANIPLGTFDQLTLVDFLRVVMEPILFYDILTMLDSFALSLMVPSYPFNLSEQMIQADSVSDMKIPDAAQLVETLTLLDSMSYNLIVISTPLTQTVSDQMAPMVDVLKALGLLPAALMEFETMTMLDGFVFEARASKLIVGEIIIWQDSLTMEKQIIQTDNMNLMYDVAMKEMTPTFAELSDTLYLLDSLVFNLPVVKTAIVSDNLVSGLSDVLLYQMPPNLMQFADAMQFAYGLPTNLLDYLTTDVLSDPFNAALSGVWTQVNGTMAYDGSTGLFVSVAGSSNFNAMKRNDITYQSSAQRSQVKVTALNSGFCNMGPFINIQAAGVNGYFANCFGGTFNCYRVNSAASLTLILSVAGSVVVGDLFSLENDGTGKLTVRKNGTAVATVTNANPLKAGTVGVACTGGVQASRIQNWIAAPIADGSWGVYGMTESLAFVLVPSTAMLEDTMAKMTESVIVQLV